MNTNRNQQVKKNQSLGKPFSLFPFTKVTRGNADNGFSKTIYHQAQLDIEQDRLLTNKSLIEIELNQIPDLRNTCKALYNTFFENEAPYTALQFTSILGNLKPFSQWDIEKIKKSPEGSHVLVQNELLKVVLIHWHPGKTSNIHGHPAGGGVFKVLYGSIEEWRYTTNASPKLLATSTYETGSIGYIDDQMGYHSVSNPFGTSAISLHAYTRGLK